MDADAARAVRLQKQQEKKREWEARRAAQLESDDTSAQSLADAGLSDFPAPIEMHEPENADIRRGADAAGDAIGDDNPERTPDRCDVCCTTLYYHEHWLPWPLAVFNGWLRGGQRLHVIGYPRHQLPTLCLVMHQPALTAPHFPPVLSVRTITAKLAKAHSLRESAAKRRSALFAAAQERSTQRDEEKLREKSEQSRFEEKYMVCWGHLN